MLLPRLVALAAQTHPATPLRLQLLLQPRLNFRLPLVPNFSESYFMSATSTQHGAHAHPSHDGHDDHGPMQGWRRWAYATNHKDIGTMYLIFSLVMFLTGGTMAMFIRLELLKPGIQFLDP